MASESKAPEEAAVAVGHPARRTIHYVVEQPGRIEAFEQTPIYAKIPGYVQTVAVDIGDRVKRGDLLVEMSVPEVVEAHHARQALVTQAELGVTQSERSIDVTQASIATAQADLDVARAAAKRPRPTSNAGDPNASGMEQLSRDKVVDTQSRDEVENQCRAAQAADKEAAARIRGTEASLIEARARLAKTKTDLAAAKNQLVVAQAEERESAAMLSYSRILAPYDGVISDRQVHTGHFLNAANGSTTGHPLLVVVRTDKVRVFAEVPEADAVRVAGGATGPHSRADAQRSRISPAKWPALPGRSIPRSARCEPRSTFDNPTRMLRPGMYCHSLIDVEHAAGLGNPGKRRARAGRNDVLLRRPRRQDPPPAASTGPSRRRPRRSPQDASRLNRSRNPSRLDRPDGQRDHRAYSPQRIDRESARPSRSWLRLPASAAKPRVGTIRSRQTDPEKVSSLTSRIAEDTRGRTVIEPLAVAGISECGKICLRIRN